MDIISHGLWGSVAFGRKSRKEFWQSFAFGVGPDFFSFGIYFLHSLVGFVQGTSFFSGPPPLDSIPQFVFTLYNYTHSFVIFGAVFGVVWFLRGAPMLTMLAWPMHILFDIFTHTLDLFPTPFLWPISDYKVGFISWGESIIFIPNVVILFSLLLWFYVIRPRINKKRDSELTITKLSK